MIAIFSKQTFDFFFYKLKDTTKKTKITKNFDFELLQFFELFLFFLFSHLHTKLFSITINRFHLLKIQIYLIFSCYFFFFFANMKSISAASIVVVVAYFELFWTKFSSNNIEHFIKGWILNLMMMVRYFMIWSFLCQINMRFDCKTTKIWNKIKDIFYCCAIFFFFLHIYFIKCKSKLICIHICVYFTKWWRQFNNKKKKKKVDNFIDLKN